MKKLIALIILCSLRLSLNAQTVPPDKNITITMPVKYWETVLSSLNKLPYETANPVITTITGQAYSQLQPKPDSTAKQPAKKP